MLLQSRCQTSLNKRTCKRKFNYLKRNKIMKREQKEKQKGIVGSWEMDLIRIGLKKNCYFLPKNWPILASHLPHLCKVTPLYLELPLGNPVLCRRSTCTNSSLVRLLICYTTKIIFLFINDVISMCFHSKKKKLYKIR